MNKTEIGSATAKGGFANKETQNSLEYKRCYCPNEYWEVIIADNDENFDGRTTVYYHCDYCGEDFVILDFETSEILYKRW